MKILTFDEINISHQATGYHGRTDLPAFHIFTLEDTYPTARQVMPPYTFNFYQVVLLENSSDAALNMNTAAMGELSDSVTFASPLHVLAWVRGVAQRGFILYFKEEFLSRHPVAIQDEFPYFRLTELNLLRLQGDVKQQLCEHFVRLLSTYQAPHPYRVQMLQGLLLTLLFDCKGLYDAQQQTLQCTFPHRGLAFRFEQFVNQHFLTHKTVKAYADLLNVSPDYLSETIKVTTGKTAYRLITERILLEAKKLLAYSDLSIAQIADFLGYAEPTHFSRFFRRHLGLTPHTWRQQQQL